MIESKRNLCLVLRKYTDFLRGLKPALRTVCSVDPSNHNQIWNGEDFDQLVQYVLTMEQSHKSVSAQVIDEPSKVEATIWESNKKRKTPTVEKPGTYATAVTAPSAQPEQRPVRTLEAIWPAGLAKALF